MAAHLYRHTPWAKNSTARVRNRLRVADVWLDDYKSGVFHMHKHHMVGETYILKITYNFSLSLCLFSRESLIINSRTMFIPFFIMRCDEYLF